MDFLMICKKVQAIFCKIRWENVRNFVGNISKMKQKKKKMTVREHTHTQKPICFLNEK
jgi:hypothetical protein